MPTRHKAELQHQPLDWEEAADYLHEALVPSENVLFPRPHSPSDWDEIVGILMHSAAIRVEGGHKPAGKILGTLRAICRQPEMALHGLEAIDSEALGVLAIHYRRDSEARGAHWYDVRNRARRFLHQAKNITRRDDDRLHFTWRWSRTTGGIIEERRRSEAI
jgi:hypothetical protein